MTDSPESPDLTVEEARALHLEGRFDEAEQAYRRIIAQDPASAEAIHLAGVLSLQRGRATDGLALTSRAVRLDGRQPRYHNSLGNAQMASGRAGEAAESFGNALAIDPDFSEARFNLGCALQSQGKVIDAERVYRETLARTPEHTGALVNLGALLQVSGRTEEAGDMLERAVASAPDNAEALWNLGNLRAAQDRIEDAEAAVGRLLEAAPGHLPGRVLEAQLMRRRGRLDEALDQLKKLVSDTMPEVSLIEAMFELGQVYDALDKPWLAFEAFEEGNRRRAATPGYQASQPELFIARVRACRDYFSSDRLAELADIGGSAAGSDGPIFLAGFPCSGEVEITGALTRHAGLNVGAERAPLAAALARLNAETGDGPDYPARLDALTPEIASACRSAFMEAAGEGTAVDPQPLNIADLGFVNAVLPSARVVLLMRDPRDVVLNCFFTRFRPSDATANFADLQHAAALYDNVMGLWRHYAPLLRLRVHEVRYEALFADPRRSIQQLLQDLGVDRDSEMDALGEPVAGPPGTWRRYKGLLDPVMPLLAPYAEAFGYEPG